MRSALISLNPDLPSECLDDAFRQLTLTESPNLYVNNHRFHRLQIDGVPVNYQVDRRTIYTNARLVDWENPGDNDWLAVIQFSVRKAGSLADPNLPLQDTYLPDIFK